MIKKKDHPIPTKVPTHVPHYPHLNHSSRQNLLFNLLAMIKPEYKYSEITSKIIGSAIEVHKTLGNGFQEVIYQRALQYEMEIRGLSFARELEMVVLYKDKQVGTRRVDFLVENSISVELKAVLSLDPVHLAQAINYLEAYNLEIGLLINFGNTKLEFHRIENKKFKS
jgi:GxxExxY protein